MGPDYIKLTSTMLKLPTDTKPTNAEPKIKIQESSIWALTQHNTNNSRGRLQGYKVDS